MVVIRVQAHDIGGWKQKVAIFENSDPKSLASSAKTPSTPKNTPPKVASRIFLPPKALSGLVFPPKVVHGSSQFPVKLGDIKTHSPQIENQVAKDRIRVAPQNRRKPSRYRPGSTNNAPPKPARSASSFSFKEDSFLTKIDEDSDNFANNVSRHASNASRGSGRDSLPPSSSRSSSIHTRQSSLENDPPLPYGSTDHVPRALVNKHSFSTADDFGSRKERSVAQRSYSTNSRENVNRPKMPPAKPPRSANTSTQSLDHEDVPVKKLSLGELKNKLFYSESFDSGDQKKELSREEIFGSRSNSSEKLDISERGNNRYSYGDNNRLSYGDKRASIGNTNDVKLDEKRLSIGSSKSSLADKRNSIGDKRNSIGDKRISIGDKRNSIGDKRNSIGDKRNSIGDKRNSIGDERNSISDKRDSYSYGEKRDSYGTSFRLSNGKISSTTELSNDENGMSRENVSSFARQNSQSKEGTKELVFDKDDNASPGMLAMALTSPRQDRRNETQLQDTNNMSRSKSLSEKLEKQHRSEEDKSSFGAINNSKSLGHVNKPQVSPFKSVADTTSKSDAPLEFKRISLKTVPKKEDYLESETTPAEESSDIQDFINTEMNLEEDYSNTPTKSVLSLKTNKYSPVSLTNDTHQVVAQSEEEVTSMSFTRSSVNNIDLNTSTSKMTTPERVGNSDEERINKIKLRSASIKSNGSADIEKRYSLKSSSLDTQQQQKRDSVSSSTEDNVFKRHSLKKVDRYSSSSSSIEQSVSEQNDLDLKRNSHKKLDSPLLQRDTSEVSPSKKHEVAAEERLSRPLIANNRPTVHSASPKKNFSFQSSDVVMSRSKSLSSSEQKRLDSDKKTPSEESNESEPEWFKLARLKQKTEDEQATSMTKDRPMSPPLKPKPKVSPRPPTTGSKPEISPRPPVVAKKPPPVSPQKPITISQSPTNRPSYRSSPSPSTTTLSKDQCVVCRKTAYAIERIDVDKKAVVHKNCAKCEVCNRKLNIGGIFLRDNSLFCSHHKV